MILSMLDDKLGLETIEAAQNILSRRFEGQVELEAVEILSGSDRSYVVRCRVVQGPWGTPANVVVKRALALGDEKYDPESSSGPAVRLSSEWASLQFLNECFGNDAPIPGFWGGDRELGLLVMQDLGAGKGLHTLLQGDDASAAENALIELFQVTGRMHAVSIGKASRFQELREALGTPPPDHLERITEQAKNFTVSLEILGLECQPELAAEISAGVQMVLEPGPFHAFIHCDPCPDNCVVTESGLKLLDFEFGQFGFALWDGAYARSHFPTCWCVNRIPAELIERVEAAYRAELIAGCPQAADDNYFGPAVVVGCMSALFLTLHCMPGILEQDGEWGIATQRQRVLVRLAALAGATVRWNCFSALGRAAHQMEEILQARWLPEMDEMPFYPAFRGASG